MEKKKMKIITKIAIVSTVILLLSILAWKLSETYFWIPLGMEWCIWLMFIGAGATSILSWIAVILSRIAEGFGKPVNICVLFGGIDLLAIVIAVGYGIYDIMTDTGFLAGLWGYLILIYVVPFLAVLLIVDIIVYFVKRKRSGKETVS